MFGINQFTFSALSYVVSFFTYFVFWFVGEMLKFGVYLMNFVINLPVVPTDLNVNSIPVIYNSWQIMRDFANMFFIVALIIMAFATIFDISKYNLRALIVRFLIIALLINFSLVIGGLIINATQAVSNVFLSGMGSFSDQIGQGLNPSSLLGNIPQDKQVEALEKLMSASIFGTIFAIFLLGLIAMTVLTAAVVAMVRIPILWGLLIVAPIAWTASIFPQLNFVFKKWWDYFLGWTLFLPVYLFFLYFGLYFLGHQGDILKSIATSPEAQKGLAYSLIGNDKTVSVTLQIVFFYIFTAMFISGGLKVALSMSFFSASGVGKLASSTNSWAKERLQRATGISAIREAGQQRLKQLQEEGLPGRLGKIYGGQYGQEQKTGRMAQLFGVRGAEIKNQRAFVERAGKDYQDFERQYQNGQITEADVVSRAKQFDATDPRGFAYRKLAAKIGQLDNDTFTSTLTQLSRNPLAAEDFAKTAGAAKFSKMKGSDLAKMAAAEKGTGYDYTALKGSVAARREMFRYVQTDTKAASGLSDTQFETGLSLFGGHTTAEGRAFMKDMGKVSPDYVMNYNLDGTKNPDGKTDAEEGFEKAYGILPAGTPAEQEFQLRTHILGGSLKGGDIKDTASINIRLWEKSPEFKEALKIYIGQLRGKAQGNYVTRLEKALLDTQGGDKKIEILYNEILGPKFASGKVTRNRVPPPAPTSVLAP